jgi:cell division initiation protein
MKITPIEIRQKQFEKGFRGYDKDEVDSFLQTLSTEWERMLDDHKELRTRLEQAEKEVQKLREVESSLFKTLKTAEETGQNLVEQANKTSELMLREAQMNADALMAETKHYCKSIIEESEEKAKDIVDDAEDKVKEAKQEIKSIENIKDNLLLELKNLSTDILEKIQKIQQKGQIQLKSVSQETPIAKSTPTPPSFTEKSKIMNEVEKTTPIVQEVIQEFVPQPATVVETTSAKVNEVVEAPSEISATRAYLASLKAEEKKEEQKSTEGSFFDQFK